MGKQQKSEKLTFKELKIFATKIGELKVQCKKCGHKEIFTKGFDRKICTYCGNYIYKDEQTEFKYKMKSVIRRGTKRI